MRRTAASTRTTGSASNRAPGIRYCGHGSPSGYSVAEEIPVALEYNGISHAVMMASPADLEDFTLGFSLSEGILHKRSELYECELVEGCDGIQVQLQIATERFVKLKEQRRNLTGR